MKNMLLTIACLLSVLFLAGTGSACAQSKGDHPAPDVDGKTWLHSTEAEKKAFVFGASSAIVLEYHVRDKRSEEPSPFIKGWVNGLKNMSWSEVADKITSYYKNNPDQLNRHVFEVVWHEIIPKRVNK